MVTDDERREVARMLRELPGDSTYPDLIGVIADHDGWYPASDAADRLADLIEPSCDRDAERTCRVESSHEVEGDGCYVYFEYELTCGHEIAWGDQLPPSYCPECGRMVLYDSDDYI